MLIILTGKKKKKERLKEKGSKYFPNIVKRRNICHILEQRSDKSGLNSVFPHLEMLVFYSLMSPFLMKSTYRLYQETGDISCVSMILRDAFGKFYWWTHFLPFLWNTVSWDRQSFAKGYLIVFRQWQLQTSKNTNMNKGFWYIFLSASPTTAFLFSLKTIESINRTAFSHVTTSGKCE